MKPHLLKKRFFLIKHRKCVYIFIQTHLIYRLTKKESCSQIYIPVLLSPKIQLIHQHHLANNKISTRKRDKTKCSQATFTAAEGMLLFYYPQND